MGRNDRILLPPASRLAEPHPLQPLESPIEVRLVAHLPVKCRTVENRKALLLLLLVITLILFIFMRSRRSLLGAAAAEDVSIPCFCAPRTLSPETSRTWAIPQPAVAGSEAKNPYTFVTLASSSACLAAQDGSVAASIRRQSRRLLRCPIDIPNRAVANGLPGEKGAMDHDEAKLIVT